MLTNRSELLVKMTMQQARALNEWLDMLHMVQPTSWEGERAVKVGRCLGVQTKVIEALREAESPVR